MDALESAPTNELSPLISELTNTSKSFSHASGPEGYGIRVEIISKAQEIINAVRGPQDMAFSQSNSVSIHSDQHSSLERMLMGQQLHEMMAIRTLLSLNVLKEIPDQGSISLSALSLATGVQDSLLGISHAIFSCLA